MSDTEEHDAQIRREAIADERAKVVRYLERGGTGAEGFAARPLILARYSRHHLEPVVPAPWSTWTIWQDDGTGGRVAPNGIDLDFNVCRLTAAW